LPARLAAGAVLQHRFDPEHARGMLTAADDMNTPRDQEHESSSCQSVEK